MAVLNFMDVSTGHLTQGDVDLLEARALPIEVMTCEFGWIVSTAGMMGGDAAEETVAKLSACGLSDAFLEIAKIAGARDCWILRFDADADLDPDLPIGGYGLNPEYGMSPAC